MNQSYNFILRPATATQSAKWIEETAVTPSGGTATTLIGPPSPGLTAGAGADVLPEVATFGGDGATMNGLVTAAVIGGNPPERDPLDTSFVRASVDTFGASINDGESARALFTNALTYTLDLNANVQFPAFATDFSADINPLDFYGQMVLAGNYAFDGANAIPLRTASAANMSTQSGIGTQLTSQPGEWSINHTPATNTQATITRAAGAAGVRHVCKSITATITGLSTAAADTTILVNLRDGATGAGTILWSTRLLIKVGDTVGVALSNLNIVGSEETAMTLEFSAAGGADTFEAVALTGFSAE